MKSHPIFWLILVSYLAIDFDLLASDRFIYQIIFHIDEQKPLIIFHIDQQKLLIIFHIYQQKLLIIFQINRQQLSYWSIIARSSLFWCQHQSKAKKFLRPAGPRWDLVFNPFCRWNSLTRIKLNQENWFATL